MHLDKKIKSVVVSDNLGAVAEVFYSGCFETSEGLDEIHPRSLTYRQLMELGDGELARIETIFTTWGVPIWTRADLDRLPSLKVVFHAAGSVRHFGDVLLRNGVRICSGWRVNAHPVVDFTLAQVFLACKGAHRNARALRGENPGEPIQPWAPGAPIGPGFYRQRVAVLGTGTIATAVTGELRARRMTPVVVDSWEDRRAVSLEQAFETCLVVSNHYPNVPNLSRVIDRRLLERIPEGGTFINTGRGEQVCEKGLIQVLRERPDLTAILDVTDPEPPALDSPLRTLPNIVLTSHIAGTVNLERRGLADAMIAEFKRWRAGEKLEHEVSRELFVEMA